MMNPPQQPPAAHLMLNVINRLPSALRRRAIRHPQKKPRDELNCECENQRRSPHVAPPRSARDRLKQQRMQNPAIPCSRVQPIEQRFSHTRGFLLSEPSPIACSFTLTMPPAIVMGNRSSPRGLTLP